MFYVNDELFSILELLNDYLIFLELHNEDDRDIKNLFYHAPMSIIQPVLCYL